MIMAGRRRRRAAEAQAAQAQIEALRQEVDHLKALLDHARAEALHHARIEAQRAVDEARTSASTPPPPTPGTSLADLDERLTGVASELTRQIEELSGDLEHLDQLRSGQERLAAEQVRYDLALRAELAELADEVRRRPR
jgi:FtsZ-binding cell division protein ZapB